MHFSKTTERALVRHCFVVSQISPLLTVFELCIVYNYYQPPHIQAYFAGKVCHVEATCTSIFKFN